MPHLHSFQILTVNPIFQTANVLLKAVEDVLLTPHVQQLLFKVPVSPMSQEQFVSGIQLVLVHAKIKHVSTLQPPILMMPLAHHF